LVNNRMNEVMKVLTVFAAIFIPLTFIAGVYGMNFSHMPELDSPWGYPMIWAVFISIVVGMLWFFRRRQWL
jgi:magnesium transporter